MAKPPKKTPQQRRNEIAQEVCRRVVAGFGIMDVGVVMFLARMAQGLESLPEEGHPPTPPRLGWSKRTAWHHSHERGDVKQIGRLWLAYDTAGKELGQGFQLLDVAQWTVEHHG